MELRPQIRLWNWHTHFVKECEFGNLHLNESRILSHWSAEGVRGSPNPPTRSVDLTKPKITTWRWETALIRASSHAKVISQPKVDGRRVIFIQLSDTKKKLTHPRVREWCSREGKWDWPNFDSYQQWHCPMWKVVVQRIGSPCPVFTKLAVCKHIIGVSLRLRIPTCIVPEEAKKLTLQKKPRRGRPALAHKALIRQWFRLLYSE